MGRRRHLGLKAHAEEAAKKFGIKVVYNAGASLTQPDYTSHCLGAQSAGAEIFAVSLDGNSVQSLARSCAAVGFHPIYSSISVVLNVDFDSNPTWTASSGRCGRGPGSTRRTR